ncbi:Amsh-like ubiquitin thioesterase [Thalictrum thalictroides]|uniref:Amsh-like ubiquitin thioesterase n=1 Tax=Thalictrum thalictroides TaxID=46969 RepID=A0A7J6V338_THATH|nr:Amsh-like ubiquitin thioesterase [Thalictrum thalictroides]
MCRPLTRKQKERLVSKIPQHSSYSTYSVKEKLHHNKIHQELSTELEILKSQLGHDFRSQKNQELHSYNEREVKYGGTEETKIQSSEINVNCVTQSSPSPVLTFIQSVPEAVQLSHIAASDSRNDQSQSSCQDVHISVRLMADFLELARDNTNKDLETCGVLGAFLKNGVFYITTLIIPKQETTPSSCQALNEEEIYAIQSEHSLFPLGWIHTHPSQSCFMSSIDLHTQYCYQLMLPEAVAIVMAPTDATRSYGVFRLSDPGGTTVVKECQERGFHPHKEPSDGSPIYEDCSNIYFNPNLRFEIFDLR